MQSIIHPKALPSGVVITPNVSGKHVSGAGGETIDKYVECLTNMTTKAGDDIGNNWNVADVARPLRTVSQVTGPADHPQEGTTSSTIRSASSSSLVWLSA